MSRNLFSLGSDKSEGNPLASLPAYPVSSGLAQLGDLPRYVGDSLGELFAPAINARSRLMFNQLNQLKTVSAVEEAVLTMLREKHESGAQVGTPQTFEKSPPPNLSHKNMISNPVDLERITGDDNAPGPGRHSADTGDNLSCYFLSPCPLL